MNTGDSMFGMNATMEDMNSVVRHASRRREGLEAADCVILRPLLRP